MAQPTHKGDFETLLAPHLALFYGAALYLTRNRDDAEDLVQEAAIQAFRAFHTFQSGTNFKAWFLRIQTNLFYSAARKRKREPERADLEDVEDLYLYLKTSEAGLHQRSSDPASLVLEQFDQTAIQDALSALPDDHRVVATLYFLESFSYQEIADMVGIPVGTVRSRLHRARKMLQKALWHIAESRGYLDTLTAGESE
jgi:RNA polymerase sigma-70 factor (ECF subfamily)